MATKEKEYNFIWGSAIRRQGVYAAGRSRLWLGKDHLLSVSRVWFTEEYRRFYFRDIQAIIIRKTQTGKIINIVFGALTLLTILAAIATADEFRIFWLCVGSAFGLILFVNAICGPTCATHMRTAVQTEHLISQWRLRRANRLMARLRPLIATAQGELSAAEIPARMEQLAYPRAEATVAVAPQAG